MQSTTDIDMGRKSDDIFLIGLYDNFYHLEIVLQKLGPLNLALTLKHNVSTTVLNFVYVNSKFEKIETYL